MRRSVSRSDRRQAQQAARERAADGRLQTRVVRFANLVQSAPRFAIDLTSLDMPGSTEFFQNQSTMLFAMKQYQRSLNISLECVAILEALYGPNSPLLCNSLRNIG